MDTKKDNQREESQAWQASKEYQGTITINDPTWLNLN